MKPWILAMMLMLAGLLTCPGLSGCGGDDEEGETQTITVTNEVGEVVVVEVPVDDDDGTAATDDPDVWFEEDDDIPASDRPALEAPSLISPDNGATFRANDGSASVTVSWTAVDGAEYYLLRLNRDGAETTEHVNGTSDTWNAPIGDWTWAVAAVSGDLREWTGTRSFSVLSTWGVPGTR